MLKIKFVLSRKQFRETRRLLDIMQYLKALFTFRSEAFQRQKHPTLEEWGALGVD